MIKFFSVKNFTSFDDWMDLDFTLNDKVPEKFHNGNNISNVLCLKGANASGKTNALKAIAFIADFIKNGFYYHNDSIIAVEPFFFNSKPVEFNLNFMIENDEYEYDLITTKEKIYSEILKRNTEIVIEREFNQLQNSKLFDGKNVPLRFNLSVLSSAYQYPDLQNYVEKLYSFFDNIIFNVSSRGFTQYPDTIFNPHVMSDLSKNYIKNNLAFDFTKKYLKKFDIGILDVEIEEKIDPRNNKKEYYPVFIHSANNREYKLTDVQESSGTRALFHHLFLYLSVLESGGLLILDEFDVNLHPDILPYLIDLFTNKEHNKNNAQIVFTTHNNDIMEIVGKYRTYLFEKNDNKSYCYRLDEIDNKLIRNDRAITPLYEKGLLGGVPRIKNNV